jgi:hypothetical protein
LSIAYVGTQGHVLLSNLEANPGDPALCLSVSQPSQVAPGRPTCVPMGENGVYTRRDGSVINGTRYPLGPSFGSNGYHVRFEGLDGISGFFYRAAMSLRTVCLCHPSSP